MKQIRTLLEALPKVMPESVPHGLDKFFREKLDMLHKHLQLGRAYMAIKRTI